MREIDLVQIFDIANKSNSHRLMRDTMLTLQQNRDLGFVLLHSVAAFIDGLVAAPRGKVSEEYCKYLEAHFPDLCRSIEAKIFYENIRCTAIHEFALAPPLALGHANAFQNPNEYSEPVTFDGADWLLVNVDLIASDFLEHLDHLDQLS